MRTRDDEAEKDGRFRQDGEGEECLLDPGAEVHP